MKRYLLYSTDNRFHDEGGGSYVDEFDYISADAEYDNLLEAIAAAKSNQSKHVKIFDREDNKDVLIITNE